MKAQNIREVRKILGFNQEEFAYFVGISAVYLSQIETGSRELTRDVAEKIAMALSWLSLKKLDEVSEKENMPVYATNYPVKADNIRVNHIASFYPGEIQEEILTLLYQKSAIEFQLDYLLEAGEPFPRKLDYEKGKPEPIFGFLKIPRGKNKDSKDSIREMVSERVEMIKEKYKDNKKNKPAYQKGGYFFDKVGKEKMGIMLEPTQF